MNTWNLPSWLYVAVPGATFFLGWAILAWRARHRERAATRRRWAAVQMRQAHAAHILGSQPADLPDVQTRPQLTFEQWERLTKEREELF